jgi:hypothetical protein
LHFRVTFAVLGVLALLAGGLFETLWLAGSGALAAAASDVIGVLQSRVRFPEPASRMLRGASEALPSLGVAAHEPFAIGVAVVVVVYAVMIAGLETVCTSRGMTLGYIKGETTRRVLTSACSLALLFIPLMIALGRPVQGVIGRDPRTVAAVVVVLVALVGMRGLLDFALEIRRTGRMISGQNVDT